MNVVGITALCLVLIQHTHSVDLITCFSDSWFFTIVDRTRVIIKELFSPVSVSSMLCLQSILVASHFHHAFQKPELQKLSSVQSCLVSVHCVPSIHFSTSLSSRSQKLISTALHSMHGNTVNLQMQKHYYQWQSWHGRIDIMYLLVKLLFWHTWDSARQHSSMQ